MDYDLQQILSKILVSMPILWLSLSVHEAAHAATAELCGDSTARDLGRVTLNPLSHIDLIGTVAIPIVSMFMGGFGFIGWAKPVPVDPRNFGHQRRDNILVSLAGPISNLMLSIGFMLLLVGMTRAGISAEEDLLAQFFYRFAQMGMMLNVGLAVFNMLPFPPLDGSHVLAEMLPKALRQKYNQISQYGFVILLVFINVPIFQRMLSSVILFVIDLLLVAAHFLGA